MELTNKEERNWAMFAHLSSFAGHFIPFGHIAGPFIIWSLKKDEMPLVNTGGPAHVPADARVPAVEVQEGLRPPYQFMVVRGMPVVAKTRVSGVEVEQCGALDQECPAFTIGNLQPARVLMSPAFRRRDEGEVLRGHR